MKELFIDIAYLVSAVSFIYGLKMLSHPKTARNGNIVASLGMLIAVIATVYLGTSLDFYKILIAMTIGSIIGAFFAIRVEMTQMPQLVAIFNGFGGAASALVASAEFFKTLNSAEEPTLFLILTIGISHGSLDHIKGKKLIKFFGFKSMSIFYLSYLLIGAVTILIWLIFPKSFF